MRSYLEARHRFFGILGALIALAIAVVYLYVIPEEAADSSGIHKMILVYGHSLCWFLLAGASFLWAIVTKNKWSRVMAYAALVSYAIFMSSLLITKFL